MAQTLRRQSPMARRPRLQFPGALYHVMSRGNRKSPIFDTHADRDRFMRLLAETALAYEARVYAACAMGTHYHLLLDTPRGNLSEMMRQLNATFSQEGNRLYQRTGHTFEARFHSIVVQRERYLRRVARYVVLNPVKAGLCGDPGDWRWTTYRATAGLEPAPRWLYMDWIDWAFRAATRPEAQGRYRTYVNGPAAPLEVATREHVLGTRRYHRAVRAALEEELRSDRPVPRFCRETLRPSLERLFDGTGSIAERSTRDHAILLAHQAHGYRLSEIARFLGMHPTTASKALRRARARQAGDEPPVHDS
jgi:putative transposase